MTDASPYPAPPTAQVLIFDADDTLWENNVLFERVIDDYLDWLVHPVLSRDEVRSVLDDIERANAVTHGYGSKVFLGSLADCFARLRERPATGAELEHIAELAAPLIERGHVELMPGVADTLAVLAGRHDLRLLTKGAVDEQREKIEASGLDAHFRSVHIVAEKNTDTYTALVEDLGLDPEHSWMIGNSPKSDIIPARKAGLRAVFIPHPHTWVLEQEEVDPGDTGVLHLTAFRDLLRHF
ncbi:HAD family hydrolase [Yinghuangia seranimata]|uniref:HAD family hydrolase n=1 Tax=Yinghuangia seranimata TaxID=408067 RepID=UPI00248BC0F9|nr:HAD family hydrolase [Yinghuangia seranimata]MDI2125803.1 HAD hydrolase-like protein [Yinghuangia seranimata]